MLKVAAHHPGVRAVRTGHDEHCERVCRIARFLERRDVEDAQSRGVQRVNVLSNCSEVSWRCQDAQMRLEQRRAVLVRHAAWLPACNWASQPATLQVLQHVCCTPWYTCCTPVQVPLGSDLAVIVSLTSQWAVPRERSLLPVFSWFV